MADDNLDIGTPSKLSESSVDYRNCSMAKNSCGYTPGDQYLPAHEDTLSDGDEKGRDPEDGNQHSLSIGTKTDVAMRECLLAKNSDLYSRGNEYCAGHNDTIADGDERGREPEGSDFNEAGTKQDFQERADLVKKNPYNTGNQYCAGSCNV